MRWQSCGRQRDWRSADRLFAGRAGWILASCQSLDRPQRADGPRHPVSCGAASGDRLARSRRGTENLPRVARRCIPDLHQHGPRLRQVDPKLTELGHVQGLSDWQLIRRIILPGALPSILTGLRYALATAWLALVVAETVGAESSIGFLAMDAGEFLRADVIVLTVVIYALIGVAADSIARHPNYGAAR
jgi:hypothetical protein